MIRQFGISQGVEDAILHTNRLRKACGSAMYRPTASERTHYCATIRPISAAPFEGNAVNLELLATTARLCAQRSAEGHSN